MNPKEENEANDVMEKTNTDSNLDKTNVEPSQVQKHSENNGNEKNHSSSEDGIVKQNAPETPELQGKENSSYRLEESRERIIETLNPSVSLKWIHSCVSLEEEANLASHNKEIVMSKCRIFPVCLEPIPTGIGRHAQKGQ